MKKNLYFHLSRESITFTSGVLKKFTGDFMAVKRMLRKFTCLNYFASGGNKAQVNGCDISRVGPKAGT